MGLLDLFGKKMSPQEAFDLLLDGNAKQSDLKKAAEITNTSSAEYMAPATTLILLLGLENGADTYPAAYNSIMMSVLIGLKENNSKCITNADRVIRKNQSFAKELAEFAKSTEKNLHTVYLAYAYSHGWGVETDKKAAMEYALAAKEHIDSGDEKSFMAVEKIIAELNA